MGIQLRGLEKRYSTVYIDGVKMSDPSSPDNSFYFQNISHVCTLKKCNHPCVSISKIENRTQDLPLEDKNNQIHGHMMHHSKHPWRGHHV